MLVRCLALISLWTCPLLAEPWLLVLFKGGSALGIYTPEGQMVSSVPVGKHPHEMVISPNGKYAYITDNGTMAIEQAGEGGNTISIIDLVGRIRLGAISLGKYRRPHGIALDYRTGRLAVTTENPDRLLIVDPVRRRVVRTYDTGGHTSHMVTLDPKGEWAYVSNSRSNNVAAIHLATGKLQLIPTGARPEGSVLSRDGRYLYVVNRDGHKITIIDTSSKRVAGEIPTSRGPVRIDITPDGSELVYAAMEDQKVDFLDLASRRIVASVALDGRPVSLHLSPDGRYALTAAQDIDAAYVISVRERKLLRKIRTPDKSAPDPVCWVDLD